MQWPRRCGPNVSAHFEKPLIISLRLRKQGDGVITNVEAELGDQLQTVRTSTLSRQRSKRAIPVKFGPINQFLNIIVMWASLNCEGDAR